MRILLPQSRFGKAFRKPQIAIYEREVCEDYLNSKLRFQHLQNLFLPEKPAFDRGFENEEVLKVVCTVFANFKTSESKATILIYHYAAENTRGATPSNWMENKIPLK